MPGNKHILQDNSLILKNKLTNLAKKLEGSLKSTSLVTREQYIYETIKVLNKFYESLNEPQLNLRDIEKIRVDDLPDTKLFNFLWTEVLDDLTTIFSELENVEILTLSNFNYITTEANRLTSRLKTVSSKLGDYILYSLNATQDALFFKDSFNDVSKIDINSTLLNFPQCDINQTEGIITLPIDNTQKSRILIKEEPLVNPNSNGTIGNNQELNTTFNGSLSVILDNNPDTWFEYERVIIGTSDNKDHLILDMTVNLGDPDIVNTIRINPNNFGTKTIIQIDDIKTSFDGEIYTSIKDDIPIAGFTTEDEENIFQLSPSTSKFAGQGLYTFTPRKVKYINFIFRQSEPYIINTSSGDKLRYAIGIRDIDIKGNSYLNEGEVISKPFESISEIRKILLESNQNPSELSELTETEYSISIDNGSSWHRIQPKDFDGPSGIRSIPEILNFNSSDVNSITTPSPINSVRLKMKLIRNDNSFEDGSSTLNKTVEAKSEIHNIPQSSPFAITLVESPVDGTISVIDPLFGSRGIPEAPYILGHAMDKIDNRKFKLPFLKLPRPLKKVFLTDTYHTEPVPASEWVHISVGGEEWNQGTQPIDQYSIDFNNLQDYKIYNLDIVKGILEFGDGITNTLGPPADQPIALWFEPERIYPSETDDDHVASLEFFTSNNKNDMIIKRYDLIKEITEILPKKATVLRLNQENIIDTSNIEVVFGAGNKKTYINGREELFNSLDWSIDLDDGTIYTKLPTSATTEISITYTYQPIVILTKDNWDWATTNILRDSISIKDSGWKTIEVKDETLPTTSNLTILDLGQFSVVKGTLNIFLKINGIDPTNSENPFLKEVDYINGTQELGGEVTQTIQQISSGLLSVAGIVSFDLDENISTISDHKITFSKNSEFITEVVSFAAISIKGDWFVQRDAIQTDYGKVYIKIDAGSPTGQELITPGNITYYFTASGYSDTGLYSVDYNLGKIYTQRKINPAGIWITPILFVTYQFADFRAEYRIARILNPDNYNIDLINKTVSFDDSEILKYQQVPHSVTNTISPFYIITYDRIVETREDVLELKEKFTPVIKDYALRVLTKDSII